VAQGPYLSHHLSKCGLQRVPVSLQLQSHGHRHHDFDAAGRTDVFFNSTGPVFGAESVSLLFFVSFFYPRGSRIRRGRKSRTSRFRFLGSDFDGFLERIDRLIPPYFIEFFNHGLLLVLADDVVNTNRSSAVVRFNVFVVRRTLCV
jgi:hypothetical protein